MKQSYFEQKQKDLNYQYKRPNKSSKILKISKNTDLLWIKYKIRNYLFKSLLYNNQLLKDI